MITQNNVQLEDKDVKFVLGAYPSRSQSPHRAFIT